MSDHSFYHTCRDFTKTLGVELGECDIIPVTFTVNENGSVDRQLPEGRIFCQMELWRIQDALEADLELQDEILIREYEYSRGIESRQEQVERDYFDGISEVCR